MSAKVMSTSWWVSAGLVTAAAAAATVSLALGAFAAAGGNGNGNAGTNQPPGKAITVTGSGPSDSGPPSIFFFPLTRSIWKVRPMSAKVMSTSWWVSAGLVTAAAAAATVSLALGAFAAAGGNGNGNGNGGTNQPPGKAITVTGSVVGKITLGTPATLNVTVNNPNNQDMSITQVTGTITSVTSAGMAGKPVCSASWYSVGTFTGPKPLPKNGQAIVAVPLTLNPMASTNQDNCKGSNVQFSFSATAEAA